MRVLVIELVGVVFGSVCFGQIATTFQFPTPNYQQSLTQTPHFFLFSEPNPKFNNESHLGEDIRATVHNMPVMSAAPGVVVYAGTGNSPCKHGGWGYVLVMEHTLLDGSRVSSIYGHLDATKVKVVVGQTISAGGIELGKTGSYPGCWDEHLHFGIYNGAAGVKIGTFPPWLAGYSTPAAFPGSYCEPSTFIRH